jgi:hypothetical protein
MLRTKGAASDLQSLLKELEALVCLLPAELAVPPEMVGPEIVAVTPQAMLNTCTALPPLTITPAAGPWMTSGPGVSERFSVPSLDERVLSPSS